MQKNVRFAMGAESFDIWMELKELEFILTENQKNNVMVVTAGDGLNYLTR